jgi:hypothetical protein
MERVSVNWSGVAQNNVCHARAIDLRRIDLRCLKFFYFSFVTAEILKIKNKSL